MDFISWSATLLKLNGFDGTQSFQLPQPTGALSAYWPWISGQHGAPPNPTSLILDLAVLEAAAVNNFWHPTETNSLSVANIVTSETNDKQHQLSFGIDRILGDQIGVNRPKMFAQVPGYARSHESEKQNISTVQKQEAVIDKQAKESRQKLHEQQGPVDHQHMGSNNNNRRKRSWSRAVFSNLQRKGLEKRFQLQKYITKPDRRQLAATLGLTDAQVKVWFQNRRMKWRHNKESHSGNSEETPCSSPIEQYLEAAEDLQCREHYR